MGKGWITVSGEYIPVGFNHWEVIAENPESFNLDESDLGVGEVKINTFEAGNIRVESIGSSINIEMWEPTREAFQRLRRYVKDKAKAENIYIDKGDGERHQISVSAFLRHHSADILLPSLDNPTNIRQFIGDSFCRQFIEHSIS